MTLSRTIDVIEARLSLEPFGSANELPVVRRIAERLEFPDQLQMPATAIDGRGKLERKPRGLKTNDARIVAVEVLEDSRTQVVSLADVNPKRIEETIDAGGFGRVLQDTFALKEVPAVTSLGEGHPSPVFDALRMYFWFEWFELGK
jgi:hypothetical protein